MIILKKMNMNIVQEAIDFEKSKMSNMSTSDRINASREAKRFILGINEIYKETNDPDLMELMKRLTENRGKTQW